MTFLQTTVSDFSVSDLQFIQSNGIQQWLVKQDAPVDDLPFDAVILSIAQQMQVVNLLEPVGISFEYVAAFRKLGNVILFALLPEVKRQVATSQPARQSFDPVVPFILNMPPNAAKQYGQHVKKFLETAKAEWLSDITVKNVLVQMQGKISQAEAVYFALAVQALRSGLWRHVPAFAPVVMAEEAVVSNSYTNASLVVNRMLNGG